MRSPSATESDISSCGSRVGWDVRRKAFTITEPLLYVILSSEPLWQPARKHVPNEVLKTVYIFSTQWANEAAEAVTAGKFNTIIQFHQNQPKGPGFHRHPPSKPLLKEGPPDKSETQKSDEKKKEEEKDPKINDQLGKGQKRRSGQASLSNDGQSSIVKKRRSSIQQCKTPPKEQSPPPFLRSSRRLRRQKNPSPIPSPPPPALIGEEEENDEAQSPPTPPSLPRPPSGTRGRITRTSQRLAKARQRNGSTNKQALPPDRKNSSAEEEDVPESSSKKSKINEESGKPDEAKNMAESPKSPVEEDSPHVDPSQVPMSQTADEDNYTICHGTPQTHSPSRADISSPKEWQDPKGQGKRALGPSHQQSVGPPDPSVGGSGGVLSPPQGNSPSVGGIRVSLDHQPGGGHVQEGGNVSHALTEPHLPPSHHHIPADYYHHKDWSGLAASPYAGMHGGYPGMYNHPIHGLPYAPHSGQPIPGSNYPYAMPYPWSHHHASLGSHREHMIQQQRQAATQGRSGEAIQQMRQGITAESQNYQHGHLRQQMPASASRFKEGYSDAAQPSTSPQGVAHTPAMDKLPVTSAPGHAPPPSLHQLGSPVSSPHGLPHHQLTHTLSRPTSHPITHEHLPHHPFPYAFETSSHHPLHMWQQTQMQAQQIRPIPGMHHAHLAPSMAPHGLWYSPAAPPLPPHLVPGQGQELLGKKSGNKMKTSDGDTHHTKITANRNTNNNNDNSLSVREKQCISKYKAKAFPNSREQQSANLSFPVCKQVGQTGFVSGGSWGCLDDGRQLQDSVRSLNQPSHTLNTLSLPVVTSLCEPLTSEHDNHQSAASYNW